MTVSRSTVHHEGAGTPSDDPRGASGGYTYWIGATKWERLRDVASSYATLGFNRVSLDICLSGDRTHIPVTDNDIGLIHGAFMDAHARGEVIDHPVVVPHRYSPGSNTVCPGDQTMARWPDVASAVGVTPTPPPEADVRLLTTNNQDGRAEVFALNGDGSVTHRWETAVGGAWTSWSAFAAPHFEELAVGRRGNGKLYLLGYPTGGGTQVCEQTAPNNGWGAWGAF